MLDLIEGLASFGYTITVVAETDSAFSSASKEHLFPVIDVSSFRASPDEALELTTPALQSADVLIMSGRHDFGALAQSAGAGPLQVLIRHSAFPLSDADLTRAEDLDAIITTSSEQRRTQFSTFNEGNDRPHMFTLLSGVTQSFVQQVAATNRTTVRNKLGIDDDATVLLSASRLSWEKGILEMLPHILTLLDAHSDMHLIVAGDGDERESLETAVAAAGRGSQVTVLGHHDAIADLLVASDVLLFSSTVPETGPLIVKEAMAAGVPVVASRVGGLSEFIEHETTGFLVDSWQEMAATVIRLQEDADLAARVGSAARDTARENHRFEERVRRLGFELDLLSLGRSSNPAKILDDLDWEDVRLRAEGHEGFIFVPRTSQIAELTPERYSAVRDSVSQSAPPDLDPTLYVESRDFLRDLYTMGALVRTSLLRPGRVDNW